MLGLLLMAFLAGAGLALGGSIAVVAWHRQQRRSRRPTGRSTMEAHLDQLTAQTLQAMRQAARDHRP